MLRHTQKALFTQAHHWSLNQCQSSRHHYGRRKKWARLASRQSSNHHRCVSFRELPNSSSNCNAIKRWIATIREDSRSNSALNWQGQMSYLSPSPGCQNPKNQTVEEYFTVELTIWLSKQSLWWIVRGKNVICVRQTDRNKERGR